LKANNGNGAGALRARTGRALLRFERQRLQKALSARSSPGDARQARARMAKSAEQHWRQKSDAGFRWREREGHPLRHLAAQGIEMSPEFRLPPWRSRRFCRKGLLYGMLRAKALLPKKKEPAHGRPWQQREVNAPQF
jgi:hypothetical protein